jgi:hypothetical protein
MVCRFWNILQHCTYNWHRTTHSMTLLTCCDNKGTGALPALLWKTRRPDNYHTWPYICWNSIKKTKFPWKQLGSNSPARPAYYISFLYCTYDTKSSHSLLFICIRNVVVIAHLVHHLLPNAFELVFSFIFQLLPGPYDRL